MTAGVSSTINSIDTAFCLDMTYFKDEVSGTSYVVWAGKPTEAYQGGNTDLFIATVSEAEPWKLTSEQVRITKADYGWERIRYCVNEGPTVLQHDGNIFLCYSVSGTGSEYAIGMLSAKGGENLLNQSTWTKSPYPLLTSRDVDGEEGPGHNSFTVDQDGNVIFVYHARPTSHNYQKCGWDGSKSSYNSDPLQDPCRHARLKRVHWAADGTPILKMTYDDELLEEYQTVSLNIVIDGGAMTTVTDVYAEQGTVMMIPIQQASSIEAVEGDAVCEVTAEGISFTGNTCGTVVVTYNLQDDTQGVVRVHVYATDNKAYVLDYGLTVDLNAAGNDAFGLYKVADTDSYSMTGEDLPAAGDSDVAVLKGFRLSGTQDEYSMQVSTEDAILNCTEEKLLYTPKTFMEDADVYDDLIRISVGIEDIEDLIKDFDNAINNNQ